MKKRIVAVSIGFVVCAALLVVCGTGAWGAIRIGTIEVIPSITQEGKWDSNIDLGADNGTAGEAKKGDYINTVTPSVTFSYQRPLIDITAGASVGIVRYDEYDRNDTENYTANLNAQYGDIGRNGIYLKVSEQFQDSQDPNEVEDQRYLDGIDKKKKTNTAAIEVGYGLTDRYALHLFYENGYLNYDNFARDRDSNKTENKVGATAYYKILPKTFATLGYTYKLTDYPDYDTAGLADAGKDSKDHNAEVGIMWKEAEKLNGSIKVGYHWKKWKQAQDSAGNPLEDLSDVTVRAAVGWKPLMRTTVNVDATVAEIDSVETGYFSYDQYALGLTIDQTIVSRLAFRVGGRYEKDDYNGTAGAAAKEYEIYSATVGVSYQLIKWLQAELTYTYSEKDANDRAFADDEYKDHLTMFRIVGSL